MCPKLSVGFYEVSLEQARDGGALARGRLDAQFATYHFHPLSRAKQSQLFVPFRQQDTLNFKGFAIVVDFETNGVVNLANADFHLGSARMLIDIRQR
jgi:hypothetical protein